MRRFDCSPLTAGGNGLASGRPGCTCLHHVRLLRFGDKHGLMNAVYLGGFESLSRLMSEASDDPDPLRRLIDLGMSYRRFAMANPALYTLMFERMVGFDPAPELRSETVRQSFASFEAAMTEAIEEGSIAMESPVMAAYTFSPRPTAQ